jgi:hypothetical protein
LRNLSISGGAYGVVVARSGGGDLRNTNVTNDKSGAILVTQASYIVVQGGTIEGTQPPSPGDNGNTAIIVRQASGADIRGATIIATDTGISLTEGASADVDGNTITGDRRGILVTCTSSLRLSGNPGSPPSGVANIISGGPGGSGAVLCNGFSALNVNAIQTILAGGVANGTTGCSTRDTAGDPNF